jgi:hypothetical protein
MIPKSDFLVACGDEEGGMSGDSPDYLSPRQGARQGTPSPTPLKSPSYEAITLSSDTTLPLRLALSFCP